MDNSELRGLLADYCAHTRNSDGCSDHNDAPHGFDRNGSHSEDRYVCDCEGWEPDWTQGVACRAAVAEALPRLLADSDELAALKARIAGARVVTIIPHDEVGEDLPVILPPEPFAVGQRVALLPVGEVEG